jgi:putative transcriptional regulator
VGKNLKMVELRGDRSQKVVAKDMKIPVSTYAMIESGHRFPRKDLQAKISRYYGVTVDELFFSQFDHVSRTKKSKSA